MTGVLMILAALFAENYALTSAFGSETLLYGIVEKKKAWRLCFLSSFSAFGASVLTALLDRFVLTPLEMRDLGFFFVLVFTAVFVLFPAAVLYLRHPKRYGGLEKYLPFVCLNGAGIGIFLRVRDAGQSLPRTVLYALAASVGLLLAQGLMMLVCERLREEHIPKPFRGLHVRLIAAALLSLVFSGFCGTSPWF